MTPVSHYPPVAHPETFEPGHFEDGTEYVGGRIVPVSKWVRHCPYHAYIELRGTKSCERCEEEAGR